jgi:hypothetical protein
MLKKALYILLCTVVSAGVAGCAEKYGAQTTRVERFPQCYEPVAQLREDEKRVTRTAAAGAAGGAILGALVGVLATGKVEGAVVGAVAGGAAGGGLAYARAKQSEIRDQNARMAVYLRDLDGDITGLNAVTASARRSAQCYDKEFKILLAGYKSGNITKIELGNSYEEIKSGMSEAERILGATLQKAGEREEQYRAALSDEAQRMETPVSPVSVAASEKRRIRAEKIQPRSSARAARRSGSVSMPEAGAVQAQPPLHEMREKTVAYRSNIEDGAAAQKELRAKKAEMQEDLDAALS